MAGENENGGYKRLVDPLVGNGIYRLFDQIANDNVCQLLAHRTGLLFRSFRFPSVTPGLSPVYNAAWLAGERNDPYTMNGEAS